MVQVVAQCAIFFKILQKVLVKSKIVVYNVIT